MEQALQKEKRNIKTENKSKEIYFLATGKTAKFVIADVLEPMTHT